MKVRLTFLAVALARPVAMFSPRAHRGLSWYCRSPGGGSGHVRSPGNSGHEHSA